MLANAWTSRVLEGLNGERADEPAISKPETLTAAGAAFFHNQSGALGVLVGLTTASVFADNAAIIASKALGGDDDLPSDFDPLRPLAGVPGPFARQFKFLGPALLEMVTIRLADNLTNYVLDIIAECLVAQPALLKSSKDQMSVDAILSFSTLKDLQSAILERKLISIAYLGFEKQASWATEHLGLPDLTREEYFGTLVELIESRNCMVHSRAKVGAKFIKVMGKYGASATVGQMLQPSVDEVFVASRAGAEFVTLIDRLLMPKFRLAAAPP